MIKRQPKKQHINSIIGLSILSFAGLAKVIIWSTNFELFGLLKLDVFFALVGATQILVGIIFIPQHLDKLKRGFYAENFSQQTSRKLLR